MAAFPGPRSQAAMTLFEKIAKREIPAEIVHEEDDFFVGRDINPQAPVHVLVVPRRHLVDAGSVGPHDADDVAALLIAAKAVADAEGIGGPDRGYRLVFNVGPDASNSVPHLHLHVLGGRVLEGLPA